MDGWQGSRNSSKKTLQLIVLLNITYKRKGVNVSEECPIRRRGAYHGRARVLPRRGNLLGDPGRQCERRSQFRSEVALQTLESRLGRDDTREERSEHACASSQTDHAAGHIPCSRGTSD